MRSSKNARPIFGIPKKMTKPSLPDRSALLALAAEASLEELQSRASALRDQGHGHTVTYSRKVFIPLTKLCRDVCGYCTFAESPRAGVSPYLSRDEVLAIAQAGKAAGCKEALFTLGDKPELRYSAARKALTVLGHDSTISYLTEMCRVVFEETGLLPCQPRRDERRRTGGIAQGNGLAGDHAGKRV